MSAPASLPTNTRQRSAALMTESFVSDQNTSRAQGWPCHIRAQSARCSSNGFHTQDSLKKRAASTDETVFRIPEGKIILYYQSSANSEEKKMHCFGAIGDGRSFEKDTNTNSDDSVESVPSQQFLSGLLDNSSPELMECSTLVIGDSLETRTDLPMVTTSDMLPSPRRRRRTSGTLPGLIPQESPVKMHTYIHPSPVRTGKTTNNDNGLASLTANARKGVVNEDEVPKRAETWMRQGHTFEQKMQWVYYGRITPISCVAPRSSLDPFTYSLPLGSTVFIINSENVANLRLSARYGIWSTSGSVNRMLQRSWNGRKDGAKIILIFMLLRASGFCGMAEMSGPYDPEASYCWASSSNYQGTFPVSWIVSKDVSFYQVAQKLRACGLDSSQVRIKNGYRLQDLEGRCYVQTMIESPHAYTRFLDPRTDDIPLHGSFGTASVPRRLSTGIHPAEELRRRTNARGGRIVGATNFLYPGPSDHIHEHAYPRGHFSRHQNSIYHPVAGSTFYTAYLRDQFRR